jgi:flagellar export protein FliJ
VKRFEFPLARVRDFRRQQLEVEEMKLGSLRGERQTLEAESRRIESEAADTRRSLMVTLFAESQDLVASDAYLRRLAVERRGVAVKLSEWQARAVKQREAVLDARRRVRLLEQLEARRLREWSAAVDREQENLSAELFLARWKNPSSAS